MSGQYDYYSRMEELRSGVDTTYRTILEPFVISSILKYCNERETQILDIGCGCGFLTTQIAQHFTEATVDGVDIDADAIECARKYSGLKFDVSDIMDFKSQKIYDILVYNMVLHNMEYIIPSLNRSYELMSRNGIIIITIPHPCFWLKDKIDRKRIVIEEDFCYNDEKRYLIPFQISNGEKHNSFLNYHHRMLETYLNSFLECLFCIRTFQEVDVKNGKPTMVRIVLAKL